MSRPKREVGATFDIHVLTPTGGGHLMTIHQERKDEGPLQFIGPDRLEHLLAVEAMMERMLGESLDAVPAVATPAR